MQYLIIDSLANAYINNGWTGLDIPDTITYEPIQLGSGDPSPTNVRPILPATTLNIGGTDVPVYGGTLNVTTGVLTVDKVKQRIDALPNSISYDQTWHRFLSNFLYEPKVYPIRTAPVLCSCYKSITDGRPITEVPDFSCYLDSGDGHIMFHDTRYDNVSSFINGVGNQSFVYELATPTTYQLTPTELINTIGIKDNIAHRLKLPLPHYFPHPVIDALKRAETGTQTADDTEILRHYLTPLGIGGI